MSLDGNIDSHKNVGEAKNINKCHVFDLHLKTNLYMAEKAIVVPIENAMGAKLSYIHVALSILPINSNNAMAGPLRYLLSDSEHCVTS